MKNMCMVTCIVENTIKMHRRRSHGSEYSRKTFPGVSCFCYYCHRSLRSILTKKPAKIEKWRLNLQNYELKIECRLQKPKKQLPVCRCLHFTISFECCHDLTAVRREGIYKIYVLSCNAKSTFSSFEEAQCVTKWL